MPAAFKELSVRTSNYLGDCAAIMHPQISKYSTEGSQVSAPLEAHPSLCRYASSLAFSAGNQATGMLLMSKLLEGEKCLNLHEYLQVAGTCYHTTCTAALPIPVYYHSWFGLMIQ